jgi:hypothetical protein
MGRATTVGDPCEASVKRLLVVVVAVTSAWAGDVPATPEHVAQDWLEAVRDGDAAAVRALMALPFTIDGFELETGPARDRCGGGTARGLRASAATDAEATRAIDCLLLDKMLRDYVPKGAIWRRTTRPGDLSGTLRVVKPAEVSRRLRGYGTAIAKIARAARLVQIVMADDDGVTNTVLVALTRDLRVSAVWIEERFAE